MADPESTAASFPTYADLAQTHAWGTRTLATIEEATSVTLAPIEQRYAESAVLGVGGMGKVLLARDARIGRDVAVKELRGDRELGPDELARFLREAQVQGQLEHPSIVPVYDIDHRSDGRMFFTMRRVVGRTLHEVIEARYAKTAAPTLREMLQAFATVCLAVDYAHARGVIHRDLKPANIMLGDFGEVYVLDWGLARLLGDAAVSDAGDAPKPRLSIPGSLLGTPLYMAPEQMGNPDVDRTADVYSLGAILFEILTNERVRDPRALFAPVEARPSVRAPHLGIAPELEAICVRATALEPTDWFPTARALHDALARYLEGDRELEQRRTLAATHAQAARAALARGDEAERGTAMRELVRALALEPTNADHVTTLGEILATPPRTTPPEVDAELRDSARAMIRGGGRHSLVASLLWFVAPPLGLVMGIRSPVQAACVLAPIAVAAVLSLLAMRARVIRPAYQLAIMASTMVATVALSRLAGPLVLTPTLVATYAIVLHAHPDAGIRRVALALGIAAMVVPVALEAIGVLPKSYVFDHGGMAIAPQVVTLSEAGTTVILLGGSLAMMIVPCLFIARLRSQLTEVQRQQLTSAWHVRRLADGLGLAPP